MRSLLFATLAAMALVAGPSLAEDDHAAHHPAPDTKPSAAAPAPDPMAHMDMAQMHKMCMGMMTAPAGSASPHDHDGQSGASTGPGGKPMTPDEMAAMQKRCAAMMGSEHTTQTPAPK